MRLDKYSNPVFSEQDLFESIYSGFELNPADTLLVDTRSDDIKNLETQLGFKFLETYNTNFEITDYDAA